MEITTTLLHVEIDNHTRHVTVTTQPRVVEVHVGQRGLPGPPGPPAEVLERTAAEPISALRAVSESPDGVRYVDPSDDTSVAGLLGVSISGGDIGASIRIKAVRGDTLDNNLWNWEPGFVFVGASGTLTQTPPTTGWEIVVGYAPSPTRINLTFDEPVKLEN